MSKYKIGDVFGANKVFCGFVEAEVIAFSPEGDAILRVTKTGEGRKLGWGDLVARDDQVLSDHYTLVKPKPAFFEVDKFYRFDGMAPYSTGYIRYEIKEIFETPQNDGRVFLQAHAEAVGPLTIAQTFLSEDDFREMIKM